MLLISLSGAASYNTARFVLPQIHRLIKETLSAQGNKTKDAKMSAVELNEINWFVQWPVIEFLSIYVKAYSRGTAERNGRGLCFKSNDIGAKTTTFGQQRITCISRTAWLRTGARAISSLAQ